MTNPAAAQVPEAIAARVIASFNDYPGLVASLRQRAAELSLSLSSDQNTDVAGLPGGYIQKLIGARPVKRFGARSLGPVLGILGVKLVMIEDPAAREKYGERLKTRNDRMVRADVTHVILTSRFMAKIGALGGRARAENLSPTERSAAARLAAMARWSTGRKRGKADRI